MMKRTAKLFNGGVLCVMNCPTRSEIDICGAYYFFRIHNLMHCSLMTLQKCTLSNPDVWCVHDQTKVLIGFIWKDIDERNIYKIHFRMKYTYIIFLTLFLYHSSYKNWIFGVIVVHEINRFQELITYYDLSHKIVKLLWKCREKSWQFGLKCRIN